MAIAGQIYGFKGQLVMDANTQQIILDNAKNQPWEKTCTLTQEGILTILIQMESELAIKQWSSILAVVALGALLWESYGPPNVWKFSGGTCNLHQCTMIALAPRIN